MAQRCAAVGTRSATAPATTTTSEPSSRTAPSETKVPALATEQAGADQGAPALARCHLRCSAECGQSVAHRPIALNANIEQI